MAEIKSEEEVYQKLREFLDNMPGGYPETDSGVEIKLLKKLFAPPEAEMLMYLQRLPEPVSVIAQRAGMVEDEAAELLESMAKQGSCFRMRVDDQPLYMALSFIVGIYEFHLKSIDRELSELLEEYLPYLVRQWSTIKTKQSRVVPVGSAIETAQAVETYDRVRDLIQQHDNIAVANCICRLEQGILGHECDRPHETCLVFGIGADYYVENKMARRISKEECLEIMDKAEEAALVLYPSNAQEFLNICCCCGCCCGLLRILRSYERPADHALSSFQAEIDPDLCATCGTCVERCQIEAIVEGDEFNRVDPARCIGCGLCVSTCPEEAVGLIAKPGAAVPPANIIERSMKMLAERGLS